MNQESIIRYILGNANPEEKCQIVEWLDEDPENMREFIVLRKIYDITLWQQDYNDVQLINPSQFKTGFIVRKLILEIVKVAAIFIAALLFIRYLIPDSHEKEMVTMQTVLVPAGQRAQLTLVDGTKVWLNANTTFTFPNHFSAQNRKVLLNGEGYFDVTSNKKQPFIVETEKYDIKVWGTKFNVLAYSGNNIFETSLLEGSVELLKQGNKSGVLIHPNERIFLKNKSLVLAPISHFNYFRWKEGLICFDNESFPDMVKKLELYFDLKIYVKNKAILNYQLSGKFRTKDGVEHILKVLQLRNKFRYKIDNKLNIITIE